ncbi:MAG: sigma-70 family RNA polymerase sigma factor [bacterium]|nr:sigma-70 family RNA polymerase sigma factor [bacterium]
MVAERTQTLVTAATQGDEGALDELVVEYLPRLQAYVRLQMGAALRAREATVDVVQSVCREVLGDIREGFEYRGRGPFLRWLFTSALNKVRDRHRYQQAARRSPDRERPSDGADLPQPSWLSPSHEAIGKEQAEALERAFDRLPEHYREVITMSRIMGLSFAEIGAALDRSEHAARLLLGRALARLAELHETT